jgi:DNA-binding XRE family transcriptional regulator
VTNTKTAFSGMLPLTRKPLTLPAACCIIHQPQGVAHDRNPEYLVGLVKRVQKRIGWTPEDRARHQAIRETFKNEPTLEALIARGELSGHPVTLDAYLNLRLLVGSLRKLRKEVQLSLSDVARRSGMDKSMLSRLENGRVANPGIETISRYLDALDKVIEWRVADASPRTRSVRPRVERT